MSSSDPTEVAKRLIESYLKAEPFVAFEIETAGGSVFTIASEDQCRFNCRGTTVVKTPDGGTYWLFAIVRVSVRAASTQ